MFIFSPFCPAAFSRDTLLNSRWLLQGVPRGSEGIWRDILEMDSGKQHIFMQRVLFVHGVTKKKAGKAQILRLPNHVWELEADVACLAGTILQKMQSFRDPSNLLVFPVETIKMVMSHFIEGLLEGNHS